MVTVEKIIAELKVGGYLDAAEYIERQFATINRTAEFGYMKAFIIEGDFTEDAYRSQLRALWTAYSASTTISMWTRWNTTMTCSACGVRCTSWEMQTAGRSMESLSNSCAVCWCDVSTISDFY